MSKEVTEQLAIIRYLAELEHGRWEKEKEKGRRRSKKVAVRVRPLRIARHRTKAYQLGEGYMLLVDPLESRRRNYKKTLVEVRPFFFCAEPSAPTFPTFFLSHLFDVARDLHSKSLQSILHLGEIRDKKKPVFLAFLGEYSEFAQTIFDLTVACMSSFNVPENFCGFFCASLKSYGDIYRSVYASVWTMVTRQRFCPGNIFLFSTSFLVQPEILASLLLTLLVETLVSGVPFMKNLKPWGGLKVTISGAHVSSVSNRVYTYVYVCLSCYLRSLLSERRLRGG
jgi:hypothetical protein